MLPILALLAVGLMETTLLLRDVLLVHEAARTGARAAAVSNGVRDAQDAAHRAVPGVPLQVTVSPSRRADGDLVTVTVVASRTIGPVTHTVRARSVARTEPIVGPAPSAPVGGWPP